MNPNAFRMTCLTAIAAAAAAGLLVETSTAAKPEIVQWPTVVVTGKRLPKAQPMAEVAGAEREAQVPTKVVQRERNAAVTGTQRTDGG
jgi:hypothetical protein